MQTVCVHRTGRLKCSRASEDFNASHLCLRLLELAFIDNFEEAEACRALKEQQHVFSNTTSGGGSAVIC